MTCRMATHGLGTDAGCVIRRLSRRTSYTREAAGAMTRLPPKLLDQVRGRLRFRHYSLRTEQVYVGRIRRFMLSTGKWHPGQMGQAEVEAFAPSWRRGPAVGRHTESGAGGPAVPVSRGSGRGVALDGESGALQATAAHSRGALGGGGRALADDAGGVLPADGGAAVRQRDAAAGMPALADQGRGHGSR
ncbi:UNVERIFIED_CONTAM: hypothetical protein EX528_17005 [Xanthomonas axonopodis]